MSGGCAGQRPPDAGRVWVFREQAANVGIDLVRRREPGWEQNRGVARELDIWSLDSKSRFHLYHLALSVPFTETRQS